jgi:hypothetical protein
MLFARSGRSIGERLLMLRDRAHGIES